MFQAAALCALPNLSGECDLTSHDPHSGCNVQQAQQAFDRSDYKIATWSAQQTYLMAWNDAFTALRIWTDCLTVTHEYAKAQVFAEHLKAAAPDRPDGIVCEAKNYLAQSKLPDAANTCAVGLCRLQTMPCYVKAIEKVQEVIRFRQVDYIPRLPSELIHSIFQHFDQHFLILTCMAVSKSWYGKLAGCDLLWHTLKIEPHRHRFANAMGSLHLLADIGPNVRALQVSNAARLWPERLSRLAKERCLDNLATLRIAGFNLDTRVLGEALLQLQSITTLEIGLIESSSLTLGVLFANLPRLSYLRYLKLDTTNGQLEAPLPRADNMRRLRIDLRGDQCISKRGVRHLLMSCPHLEGLSLSSSAENCLPVVSEFGAHLWHFELGCFDLSRSAFDESFLSNRGRERSTGLANIKIETAKGSVALLDALFFQHHETLEEIHLKINHHGVSSPLRGSYHLERVRRLFIHESRHFQLGHHLDFIRSLLTKCVALQYLDLAHAHNERALYQCLRKIPIRELALTNTGGHALPNLAYFSEQGEMSSLRSLTLNSYNISDPILQEHLACIPRLEELALLNCGHHPRDYLDFLKRLEHHPQLQTILLNEEAFYNDAELDAIGKIKKLRTLVIYCNPIGWTSLTGRTLEFRERRRMLISKYPQIQKIWIKTMTAGLRN